MSKYHKPRAGSKAFSPRKRAKKEAPSFSAYPKVDEPALIGFAAYKVGMTHIMVKDLDKNSPASGLDVMVPVTILDAPPLVPFAIRAYIQGYGGLDVLTDVFSDKIDKSLAKKMSLPKAVNPEHAKLIESNLENIVRFTLLVHTQPKKAGLSKKTPDVMELGVGGTDVKAQWEYCKGILGKEIRVSEVLNEASPVDVIAVTKGKGFQGPVKRWGIKMQKRKHKRGGHSRHIGCIGPWNPSMVRWFVPQAGQMGYHNRTEYNKVLMKLGENGDGINPDGGFIGYGLVSGDYLLLKGSVPGPSKRLIGIRPAIRPPTKEHKFSVESVSTSSMQGL